MSIDACQRVAIPVCILAATLIVWIQFHEAREHRSTGDDIRALQIARTFAAAMSDDHADVRGPLDDIAHRVQRVVATVWEQAVYPEKVTVDPQRLRPTDDLVFDLGYVSTLWRLRPRTSLEKEVATRLTRRALEQIRTVADAVRAVQAKLAQPT